MADIKKRHIVKGTVKTIKRTVKTLDRTLGASTRAAIKIKGAADAGGVTKDGAGADNAPADVLEFGAQESARYAGKKAYRGGKALTKKSIRDAVHVKKKLDTAKNSIKTAKASIKSAGQTIKTSGQAVKGTVKTAQQCIKTAKAAAQAANTTARVSVQTARATVEATKVTVQASMQAAKIIAHAAYQAAVVAVHAAGVAIQAIGAFLAAGGWILLLIVLTFVVITAMISSPAGIHFADEMQDNALFKTQQTLNQEFLSRLEHEKSLLQGYQKFIVRPAPMITQWNDITAVYSVRAQKANLVPAEMSEADIQLLTATLWDMVSFVPSAETIVSTEPGVDGAEVTVTEDYGVITIGYKTPDEMAEAYGFTRDEREMLDMVLEMYSDMEGITISGSPDGKMVNPCPGGFFNGNDYPAYPSSGKYHAGRDISAPIGSPVYAAASGTVIHVNDQGANYGTHVMLAHGNEVYTLYAHCSVLLVSVGQQVEQGQMIALTGNTGNSTGPHLHFEVREGGQQYRIHNVDPLPWLTSP